MMKIGIVGATGLVGEKLIRLLEETILPIEQLKLIASEKSKGKTIKFQNGTLQVEPISDKVFDNLNLVFFMATKEVALKYVPIAIEQGAVVIDNSNAYRLEKSVPLVVPEVNIEKIKNENRLIANPNCSTIQLVVILNALNRINAIKRVDVSTYQAVSGAGKDAILELERQIRNYKKKNTEPNVLPVKNGLIHYPILNNAIPQIDHFSNSGYTNEELKVIFESQKILDTNIPFSCTAVRIPVINGHSESVTITFNKEVDINKVYECLNKASNVVVKDDIQKQIYPLAQDCDGKVEVFVGRIRKDYFNPYMLHLFIVADNLLKGAAANALQIAEICFIEKIYGW